MIIAGEAKIEKDFLDIFVISKKQLKSILLSLWLKTINSN